MNKNTLRIITLGIALLTAGCPFTQPIDRIANQAERIADAVQAGQVAVDVGIQEALQLVGDELPDLKRSLNGLADSAAVSVGAEARCSLDFVRRRAAQSIRDIFHRRRGASPPVVCGSDTRVILVREVLTQQRVHITFGGFDLTADLQAWVTNDAGEPLSNVTRRLVLNSAYTAVLVLPDILSEITAPNANRIVLFHGATSLSGVGILSTPPACVQRRDQEVRGSTIELTPMAATNGDHEFAGHGPFVTWALRLKTDPERKILQAELAFTAQERLRRDRPWVEEWRRNRLGSRRPDNPHDERSLAEIERTYQRYLARLREGNGAFYDPVGDGTETSETRTYNLWTAPAEFRIVDIRSPRALAGSYYDTDHEGSMFHPGAPVASIQITGDTDGDDIGRTSIKVTFDTLTVHLDQVENCSPRP